MTRKRKKAVPKEKADPSRRKVRLNGGPNDEHELWLCNPPPRFVRLAIPEWATYEWVELAEEYLYRGSDPPPKQVEERHEMTSWLPPRDGSLAGSELIGTPAWERGLQRAEEAQRIKVEGL